MIMEDTYEPDHSVIKRVFWHAIQREDMKPIEALLETGYQITPDVYVMLYDDRVLGDVVDPNSPFLMTLRNKFPFREDWLHMYGLS